MVLTTYNSKKAKLFIMYTTASGITAEIEIVKTILICLNLLSELCLTDKRTDINCRKFMLVKMIIFDSTTINNTNKYDLTISIAF